MIKPEDVEKYLKEPLGEDEKERKKRQKKEEDEKKKKQKKEEEAGEEEETEEVEEDVVKKTSMTTQQRWETSLMTSSNLSQLFVHLTTLDNSIVWNKSILNTKCRLCRKKADPDRMLLCDGCDRGHHMYCLKPKVKKVPEGDWFCPECKPKERTRSPKKKVREMFGSAEDEDEDMEEDDEEEEEQAPVKKSKSRRKLVESEEEEEEATPPPRKQKTKPRRKVESEDEEEEEETPPKKEKARGRRKVVESEEEEEEAPKKSKKGKKETPKKGGLASLFGRRQAAVKGDEKRREEEEEEEETSSKSKRGKENKENSRAKRSRKEDEDDLDLNVGELDELLKALLVHEDGWPFDRPITKKDAPDYHLCVRFPIDLSTIKTRLDGTSHYSRNQEILNDIRLVFANCYSYNEEDTDEYQCALRLEKYYDKELKRVGLVDEEHYPKVPKAKKRRV